MNLKVKKKFFFFLKFFNFFKNIFRANLIKPLVTRNQNYINNVKIEYNKNLYFGDKNKKLFFYVIKRKFIPSGFFSNLFFVLDHLIYSLKKGLEPYVDMDNYPTVYNEKNIINKTSNSWEYYFHNLSKKKDIYNSSNVIFSEDRRITKDSFEKRKQLKFFFKRYIKILPAHLSKYKLIKSKLFNANEKILGISISGGLQKIVRGHWFPLPPKEILKISKKIVLKHKCSKVFLVTRDMSYYEEFKNYYKNRFIDTNLLRSKSFFLSSHNAHFEKYSRKDHRYKLGLETLTEGLLLSETNVLLSDSSNISLFAFMNSNSSSKYLIKSEFNSSNIFVARWLWYLKVYFPIIFGKINYKIIRYN